MIKHTVLAFAATTFIAACGPAPQPPAEAPPATAQAQPPVQPVVTPPPQQTPPPPVAEQAPKPRPRPVQQVRVEEPRPVEPRREVCSTCGVIAAVNEERVKGDAGYVGTLGGAGAGALAGSQFGKKSGKFAMMALGAVGGAFAGREVEKQVNATHVYHVTVDMEGGGQRTVTVKDMNGLAVGSKVRVEGNTLSYRG